MTTSLSRPALALLLLAALATPAHAQVTRADFATGLSNSIGITQLADGRILVAENTSGRVSVLSATGARTDFATGLNYPVDITQLADGRILVVELGRVSVLSSTGARSDFATGLSAGANRITRLADGRVLVTEMLHNEDRVFLDRVSALSSNGTRTDFATGLDGPYGITQLADGRILVTEIGAGRVSVLSATGARTDFATGLNFPSDITQLADGRILVVEEGRVSVLSATGARSDFATGLLGDSITQLADGRILVDEPYYERVSLLTEVVPQAGPPRYELVTTARSFAAAEADAVARGGRLASAADAAENAAIARAANGWYVWIGLTDQDGPSTEGAFVWTDGTPRAYTNWGDGEPNNYGNEDCALMTSDGRWVDVACDGARAYVVEIPTTLSP